MLIDGVQYQTTMSTFKMKRKELAALQDELSRLHERAKSSAQDVRYAQSTVQGMQVEAAGLQQDLGEQEVGVEMPSLHATHLVALGTQAARTQAGIEAHCGAAREGWPVGRVARGEGLQAPQRQGFYKERSLLDAVWLF